MRISLSACAVALLSLSCGSDPRAPAALEPATTTTAEVAVAPSAIPAPTASAASEPTATATATPAPAPSSGDKPPQKFTAYAGPKVKKTPKGAKVWAPVPVSLDDQWDILKIVLIDVARTEADVVVLRDWRGIEMFVPGALVHDATVTSGLKKGDVILVNVAAASAPARVVGLSKDGDTTDVTFKYNWVSPQEQTLPVDQVIRLTDGLTVGQEVAFKDENGGWDTATYVGGDGEKSFLIHGSGQHLMDTKALKPLTLTKIFKKGDKVWAGYDLKPAKVVAALNEATQYKVKYDTDGKEEVVDFDDVTAPLE